MSRYVMGRAVKKTLLDSKNLPYPKASSRAGRFRENPLNDLRIVNLTRQTKGKLAAGKSACQWFDSARGHHLSRVFNMPVINSCNDL